MGARHGRGLRRAGGLETTSAAEIRGVGGWVFDTPLKRSKPRLMAGGSPYLTLYSTVTQTNPRMGANLPLQRQLWLELQNVSWHIIMWRTVPPQVWVRVGG